MTKLSRYTILQSELHLVTLRGNAASNSSPLLEFDAAQLSRLYLDTAEQDLRSIMDYVFKCSRPVDPGFDSGKIHVSCIDSREFGASVRFISNNSSDGCDIAISLGTLLSLDDLFHRLACIENFYNMPEFGDDQFWPGGTCFWPALGVSRFCQRVGIDERMAGLLMLPQKRYQSYILCRLNAVGQELERSGGATFLSSFFTGIPRENGRILQAQNMVGIAMRWILLHEESHYIEGHLSFADQLRVAGEIETINSTVSHIPLATDALRRVIEWHADRSATESEFDLLMSSYEAYAEQNVPHGVRSDEIMKYSLRFMMTTIGVVNLLFRLLEIRNGVSASYPSARTRLATMFFAVAKRNHEFHTRGDFRCSWDDYMRAVLGTLRDLDSASRLIGLEAKSGLSHVPMHSISEWEGKSELQLFDDVSEHVYVAAKICAEVGFRTDAFGVSFDVSPRGQVLNDLDQCWLGELGRTVESFDQCCHGAFLRFRVR